METYKIQITFENDKTQDFVINKTSAAHNYYFDDIEEVAYGIYRSAYDLAEITNSKKVELWYSEDKGKTWELLEKTEF